MQPFDYLIVGAGLCGAVLAQRLTESGAKVIVIEKRQQVGGNLYCESKDGILVHRYGAHIFRTSDPYVCQYVTKFASFNRFTNSPIANYKGELYNLPFNMNTFWQLFGAKTPEEAAAAIKADCVPCENPQNLEDFVLANAGRTIYEKLIKGYTEKQWGLPCNELPPSIMRRIPLRFTFDNNYYNEAWQGIPVDGYNSMIDNMMKDVPVMCGVDYNIDRYLLDKMAKRVIYTGPIDALFGYSEGRLAYRSLRFEDEVYQTNNHQGVAVMNYTDSETPYTRVIEHKHFVFGDSLPTTICTKEYPIPYTDDAEPCYPVETDENLLLNVKYRLMASKAGILICGRLAEYRYYDMSDTIASAINLANEICKEA